MSLGSHEAAVNEVVALFREIAKSSAFPNAVHPHITAIDVAMRAASEDLHGEDELTWSDIRSIEMRTIWKIAYASEEFKEFESALKAIIGDLSKDLVKRFRGSEFEVIGEDVICDMQNTVYARAVSGVVNRFFENVIQAYESGAWPCGWEGSYPDGHLRTFARKSTSA